MFLTKLNEGTSDNIHYQKSRRPWLSHGSTNSDKSYQHKRCTGVDVIGSITTPCDFHFLCFVLAFYNLVLRIWASKTHTHNKLIPLLPDNPYLRAGSIQFPASIQCLYMEFISQKCKKVILFIEITDLTTQIRLRAAFKF